MKPKILVSKCLEHDNCRYDGSMIKSDFIHTLKDHVEFVTVCPEVAIGLTIPREALRIVKENTLKLVSSYKGADHTDDMQSFAKDFASHLEVDGAILKNRSPSCGIGDVKVYGSTGKVPCLSEKTTGLFGAEVIRQYPELPIEDEGRLRNYQIREHFLTRVYVMHEYRDVHKSRNIKKLIDFQSRHKYLLMAYHQQLQKTMGQCVARNDDETFDDYHKLLSQALEHHLETTRSINMMMHIFGYFSNQLTSQEKVYFDEQLSLYRHHKIPFSSMMSILYTWVLRFNVDYLMNQSIFRPYPIEIMDRTDSGKGI